MTSLPTVHTEPVNPSRCIIVQNLLMDSAAGYNRHTPSGMVPSTQFPIKNGVFSVGIWLMDFASGGVALPITGEHTLLVDGEPVATATGAGKSDLYFTVPANLTPGWRRVNVRDSSGQVSITHFIHAGTEAVDSEIPLWTHTFGFLHGGNMHRWCMIPIDKVRTPRPIEPHAVTNFSHVAEPRALFSRDLVPEIGERSVSRRTNGTLTTAHAMAYPPWFMFGKFPLAAQQDGPRGVGTISFLAGAKIGHATRFADPASGLMRINYVWSLHRFCRLGPDGKLTTLFGWRTPTGQRPIYWQDSYNEAAWEFVGDRSRIPAARRHFARSWGGDWDPETVRPNPGGGQTEGDGREAHATNPVWFATNSWTRDQTSGVPAQDDGAVWRIEFDGRDHSKAPIATELCHGLRDPFGLAFDDVRREVIVSERAAHRIIALDPVTGAVTRVVLQGQPLATVSAQDHQANWTNSLATRRAAPCVAPEGIKRHGRWLYFGSLAQSDIRRVHLDTGELQVLCTTATTRFVLVDVSDGTFYPEGTVFWGGFEAGGEGYPKAQLFNADGTAGRLIELVAWTGSEPSIARGRGPYMIGKDYVGGFAVGNGMLIAGGSRYGVQEFTLALPTDPPRPTTDAARQVLRKGQSDLAATMGFTPSGEPVFGDPLPWGLSPEADEVLRFYGHSEVVAPPAPPAPAPEPPPPAPAPEPAPPAPAPEPAVATVVVPAGGLPAGTYRLVAL